MKIRTNFVTNSSSSNVILAMKVPLEWSYVHVQLLKLKDMSEEAFKELVYEDSVEFAMHLTAYACGHSIDGYEQHERNVIAYWIAHWQADAEKNVRELGEDAAFVKEMEAWDRVYNDPNWPEPENDDEPGKFMKRALKYKADGYTFVYMFDVDDFQVEDTFGSKLREWAGKVKTDSFVLEVETYY